MKNVLYLGSDPSSFLKKGKIIHYPIIKIEPRPFAEIEKAYKFLASYTHVLFTSKHAVEIFFQYLTDSLPENLSWIAVGQTTAGVLKQKNLFALVPEEETQEGLIRLLSRLNLSKAFVFFPKSSLSRSLLIDFFKSRKIRYLAVDFYDTVFQRLEPVPALDAIDEIVFTSPSTVKAFLAIYGVLPKNKQLTCQGPITQDFLLETLKKEKNDVSATSAPL